ncbi:MAG: hypothetical protein ACKO25_09950 [Cyanobium sp.]
MRRSSLHRWVKTDCGRAKLAELQARQGLPARCRLAWFVLIAALRDWRLNDPIAARGPRDSVDGGSP